MIYRGLSGGWVFYSVYIDMSIKLTIRAPGVLITPPRFLLTRVTCLFFLAIAAALLWFRAVGFGVLAL
jgi:hypothetical protein